MQQKKENYPLNQSPFYKLSTKRKLAELLCVTTEKLKYLRQSDRLYTETEIPKKNGSMRRIENPRRELKLVQKRIAVLLGRIKAPDYLFCPVKGRSYVSNAAAHRNHRVVRTLDIKKYFPSTPRSRVFWFFREVMLCSPDVASTLADLASYKGHLPTGSPLSPIMAFYAHYDVWEQVASLVEKNSAVNSLYIDDLTISGDRVPGNLIWEIKKTIHSGGLRYHKEKRFIDRPAEVTGVIVSGEKLTPPNRQLLKRHRALNEQKRATTPEQKEILRNLLNGLKGQFSQINTIQK